MFEARAPALGMITVGTTTARTNARSAERTYTAQFFNMQMTSEFVQLYDAAATARPFGGVHVERRVPVFTSFSASPSG